MPKTKPYTLIKKFKRKDREIICEIIINHFLGSQEVEWAIKNRKI